jgi:hypothetical protein
MLTTEILEARADLNLDTILPALPSHLNFTPQREPQIRNGVILADRFWVVNPATDSVIGDSKSVHKTENFSTLWDNLRHGIALSGLDTSNAEVKFDSMDNGAAFSARIILPKHDFTKALGEAAKMQMTIRDSHDQSVKRQVQAMIYRLACLNGMLAPRESIGIKQKHTVNADAETVGKVAADFPIRLEQQADDMRVMRQHKVERNAAISFFERHVATYFTKTGVKVNKKYLEQVVGIYDNYREIGDNAYRVYNTLTHLSTHVQGRKDTDLARKTIRMEQNIQDVIYTEEFRNMSGLALAA